MSSSSDEPTLEFPAGFLWGVSTAAFQCEGAATNPCSTWTRWEQEGHVAPAGGSSGIGCDWWDNAERDFDLAAELGCRALRFSVEWSRVQPERGSWDASALERYREMAASLRSRGIEPIVTLHHFSEPIWFADEGGFEAPDAPELFTRFAERVVQALGEHCDFWLTFNEPNVYCAEGYFTGESPPGRRGSVLGFLRSQLGMARAHARAYRAIHALQSGARVSFTQHYVIFDPARPRSPADRAVARALWGLFNDAFVLAVRSGRTILPRRLPGADLSEVRGTWDFVGVNLYGRLLVSFDPRRPRTLFGRLGARAGAKRGDHGVDARGADQRFGEPFPQGIARVAHRLADTGKPIYVFENGFPDRADRVRPWVIAMAARTLHDLLAEGVDVRGYLHWTLTDNFEWTSGWGMRFGLVELDPLTQARSVRGSGRLFGELARGNRLTASMLREHAPDALGDVISL